MPVSSYRRNLPELIRSSDETYLRGLAAISRSSASRLVHRDEATTNDKAACLDTRYSLRYKSHSFTSPSLGLSRRADDGSRTRHEPSSVRSSTSSSSPSGSPNTSRAATTKAAESAKSRALSGVSCQRKTSSPQGCRDSSVTRGKCESEKVGSLISSPKWSRIKETFESGGLESRQSDNSKLRRNHSQSTSSLPHISLSPQRHCSNGTNSNREPVLSRVPAYRHSTNIQLSSKSLDVEIDYKTKSINSKRSRLPTLSTKFDCSSDKERTRRSSDSILLSSDSEITNLTTRKTCKDKFSPTRTDSDDYSRIRGKTKITEDGDSELSYVTRKTTTDKFSPSRTNLEDSRRKKATDKFSPSRTDPDDYSRKKTTDQFSTSRTDSDDSRRKTTKDKFSPSGTDLADYSRKTSKEKFSPTRTVSDDYSRKTSEDKFSPTRTGSDDYSQKTTTDKFSPSSTDLDEDKCLYSRISSKTNISKVRKNNGPGLSVSKSGEINISSSEIDSKKFEPDSFEEKVKALRKRIASTAREYDSIIKDNEQAETRSLTRSCSLRYERDEHNDLRSEAKRKSSRVSYSSEYEFDHENVSHSKFDHVEISNEHTEHTRRKSSEISCSSHLEKGTREKCYSRFDHAENSDQDDQIRDNKRKSSRVAYSSERDNEKSYSRFQHEEGCREHHDQTQGTKRKSSQDSCSSETDDEKSFAVLPRTRRFERDERSCEHLDQTLETKRKSPQNSCSSEHNDDKAAKDTVLRTRQETSSNASKSRETKSVPCSTEARRENDVTEDRKCISCRSENSESFGDVSTRRSLPKTLDLVNSSTAWKKSNTGSWMKVELKQDTGSSSTAKSRVALLAQQFNHLGASEKFARSVSVPPLNPKTKTSGKNSDLKQDLSPPKYQTTQVFKERCLSLPSSRDSSANSLKNNSPPSEDDGLKQALSAGRKLSLVKQVVQSFEEQLVSSNSSESGSSHESTPITSKGPGKPNEKVERKTPEAKNRRDKIASSPKDFNLYDIPDLKIPSPSTKCQSRPRNSKNVAISTKKPAMKRPDLPPPRKPLTPKRPLYINAPCTEDSLLAELEQWLVQKYDQKDTNSSTVKAVPNQSFLWNELGPKLSNGSPTNSPKMDGGEQRAPGNYYSLPFPHPNSPIKSTQEDHIYMEASFIKPPLERDSKHADNVSSCDSDEGWVDVSDTELDGGSGSPRNSNTGSRVRVRTKSMSSQAGSSSRKSWRDSVRELAAGPPCILDDETWNHKDYQDIMIWESVEGDDSSLSSTSDHFYEALYEEIVDNGRDNSTDVKRTNSFGLKSIEESPVDNNEATLANNGPKYDNISGLKKRNSFTEPSGTSPVEEVSRLKRNWSLTKKDIHLELDSKLNKNIPGASNIVVSDKNKPATSPTTVSAANSCASKRKTLIKFILRQKNANNAVPSTTLPTSAANVSKKTRARKKGSMFYVRWSTVNRDTRQKSQSENDIAASENNSEVDSGNGTSSERLDSNTSPTNGATIKRRPSDIRRPSSPPPLPPIGAVATVVRSHSGTKSLEILRPPLSRMPLDEKTKSLDSVMAAAGSSNESNREVDAGKPTKHLTRNGSNSERSSCSSNGTRVSSSSSSSCVPADSPFSLSPKCRSSVASSHSSHSGAGSYINAEDLASKPNTLTLSLANDSDSLCSYLLISADLKEPLKSPFEEEPLYQFYHKDAKQRATLWQSMSTMEEDDQMYPEEYSDDFSDTESEEDKLKDDTRDEGKHDEVPKSPGLSTLKTLYPANRGGIPSAMELLRQEGGGGQRTLWCEVPEVRNSGILDKISAHDRKIQEAMFEVITSEASYLKSLNILMEHFTQCPEFSEDFSVNCVLGRRERHILFSDVAPVRDVSARLLADLERRWQENIVLTNICDILYEHATKFFSVYVKYCANQVYQDRILKELKATRPDFIDVLHRLESNPICQGLDMLSFLMLPMQRITRMPLLVDAIYHRLSSDSQYHGICKLTLATLNKVVAECNEGARRMERMEEMLVISRQLDFRDCKSIPLISASRWLVKKGELTKVSFDSSSAKRTFGRGSKFAKSPVYFFLFTDLLVVGKKKNEESYVVLDYCPRNMVQVFTLEESNITIPDKLPEGLRNLFQLTMLQNNEFKTVEIILSCPLESDRTRWMEAVTPPISENPDEKIYEEWDCPQVQCVYPYYAQQPDELSLEESDVVNVLRKMPDGWYEGERLRDGQRGWFPASFSVEIISSHIRARNLRQRYRLLMLSQAYVEEQRKAFMNQVKSK